MTTLLFGLNAIALGISLASLGPRLMHSVARVEQGSGFLIVGGLMLLGSGLPRLY